LRHLPSQSSDPKQEITVDVAAEEDVIVDKGNRVESAKVMEPTKDGAIEKGCFKLLNFLAPYLKYA